MNLHEQLEAEVQAHNEIHANIEAGEKQLEAMKEERHRRFGRAQMLQELIADAAEAEDETAPDEDSPERSAE